MPLYPPSSPNLSGPLGFFGATPASQPAGYTSALAMTGKTMNAYTANAQSSAYTGGLLDLLQAAKLSDLNFLRVARETDRALSENTAQVLNQLVADLKALGILG